MVQFEPLETLREGGRPRPGPGGEFEEFVQSGGFTAYVSKTVLEDLRFAARQAAPKEIIGLLAGRVYSDGRGTYTLVTGMVQAENAQATNSYVHSLGLQQEVARRKLWEAHNTADPVGWWHSHGEHEPWYSSTDMNEQRNWNKESHIGIVVTARDSAPAYTVYGGPHSIVMNPRPSGAVIPHTSRSRNGAELAAVPPPNREEATRTSTSPNRLAEATVSDILLRDIRRGERYRWIFIWVLFSLLVVSYALLIFLAKTGWLFR